MSLLPGQEKEKQKRSSRRYKEKIKQKKRSEILHEYHSSQKLQGTSREEGRLKSCNTGCGCSMCKPWKHGLGEKFKHSEEIRLLD